MSGTTESRTESQTDIFGTKPLTKAKRVELLLKSKGVVSNVELNHITFRYGAVIHSLRQDGHEIITGPTDKYGKVIYYWHY